MTNQIITNPAYFDCECDKNYIHKKSDSPKCKCCTPPETFCEKCGAHENECSDSRQNEIDEITAIAVDGCNKETETVKEREQNMSNKNAKKTAAETTTSPANDNAAPVLAVIIPPEPKGKGGRKPMTEAQREQFKAKVGHTKTLRHFKDLSESPVFTDPKVWATLPPAVLAGVEKAVSHVRNVIHAEEREALKARLAALEATAAPVETAAQG